MNRRIAELRSSMAYAIALAKGWPTPAEKTFALRTSQLWDDARSRDQTDLLMAAGAYQDAIPRYVAFAHWPKVGDAKLALGDVAGARACCQRGENLPGKEYSAFRHPGCDARVAIEYQGEQHYRPVALFGGEDGFAATVRRDENKRQLCRLAGISLEYVRFDEDAALRLRQIADLCSDELEKRRN